VVVYAVNGITLVKIIRKYANCSINYIVKSFIVLAQRAKPIKLFFIIPLVSRVLTMIERFQNSPMFVGKARAYQPYPQKQTL
jgi:hypothetical protein